MGGEVAAGCRKSGWGGRERTGRYKYWQAIRNGDGRVSTGAGSGLFLQNCGRSSVEALGRVRQQRATGASGVCDAGGERVWVPWAADRICALVEHLDVLPWR